MTHILIIGGSDAGVSAGLRARHVDPSVETTVVAADAFPNYSICGIPYHISGDVPDWRNLAHRTRDDLEHAGLRLLLDTRARHIDPTSRTVTVSGPGGRDEELRYDGSSSEPAPSRSARRSPACTSSHRPTGCICCTPWTTPSPLPRRCSGARNPR